MPTIETTNTVSANSNVETTNTTQPQVIDESILKTISDNAETQRVNEINKQTAESIATLENNRIDKPKSSGVLDAEVEQFFNDYRESFKKIEPIQPGLVSNPEKDSIGFWGTLGDMTLSAAQGSVNAAYNQITFLTDKVLPNSALNVFGGAKTKFSEQEVLSFQDFTPKFVNEEELKKINTSANSTVPVFYEPKSLAGGLTLGFSQFITGFIGPNKLLKGAGVSDASWGIWSLRGSVAGAVTDLTVWDPNQGRLSDMLIKSDSPLLNNVVTQYLASNSEDTEWEGRMKNVIEGILAASGLTAGLKGALATAKVSTWLGIKAVKKAQGVLGVAEKEAVYRETGEAIKEIQSGNIDAPIVKKQIADGNPAININKLDEALKIGQETAKQDSESFIKSILNTKSFNSSEQVLHTIDTVSELFTADQRAFLKTDVLKNQVAEELAMVMARNKEEILKILPQISAESEKSVVKMLATKVILQDLGKNLDEASRKYLKQFGEDKKLWTKEAEQEILKYGNVIRETVWALKQQIRNSARVTQAGNIKIGTTGTRYQVEQYANIIREFDGDAVTIAKKISKSKPEEILNIVAKTKMQKTIEVFNSAYINSLLSGTSTQKVQILSSLNESLIRPLEQIGGGIIRGDHRSIRLGFAQWQGLLHNFKDTWQATKIAFKQSEPVLDKKMRTLDHLEIVNGKAVKPISGANLGFDGKIGSAIDWIGKAIDIPSRLMVTSDELFKQMNYRGRLYANALDNTMERGLSLTSKEGKANIERILAEGFDAEGRANVKNNPLNAKALEYARENAFNNDIKGGSHSDWGSSVQTFLSHHPSVRFMAPFVRTGTNIWRHVENRIPVWGVYTKQMQEMWRSGDARARAEVVGRQMLGTSAMMLAVNYAFSTIKTKDGKTLPLLTGSGPANKDVRKVWMDMGWQPYSIASVDKDGKVSYVQYNRMDPRWYIFGIAADIKENYENINEADAGDAFSAGILTVYKNSLGKAYMRGIADTLDVLSNPTANKISTVFGKVVGSAIPYGALRGEFESTVYETRSFVDGVISRASLGSVFLDPKRDILTGKPIDKVQAGLHWNPDGIISVTGITIGPAFVGKSVDVKEDPTLYELARLKVPLRQPATKREEVDLTDIKKNGQSAYDYWIQRIGETKNRGGLTFKQSLENEFNSYQYKHAQEGGEGNIGGREYLVSRIYENYKAYAYQDMLTKYPEAKKAIDKAAQERSNLLRLKPEEQKQNKLIK